MQHPKGPSRYILALLAELATLKPRRYRSSSTIALSRSMR